MTKRKYMIQAQVYKTNPLFCTRTLTSSLTEVNGIKNDAIRDGLEYKIINRLTGEIIENTYKEEVK